MNNYLLHIPLLCTFALAGCVPIPVFEKKPFQDETMQFITAGSTTKEDVLLTLGEPGGVWQDRTVFAYTGWRRLAVIEFYGGGSADIPEESLLVIEFDDDGAVKRYDITRSISKPCDVTGICMAEGSSLLAPLQEDENAKKFFGTRDKCTIYLYRNQFLGYKWITQIFLNGRDAGTTYRRGYLLWKVNPGQIEVKAFRASRGGFRRTRGGPVDLAFECERGKTYFVRLKTSGGWRIQLHLVDEGEGQEGVRGGKLILGKF